MISLISFFSKIKQRITLNFVWISILIDKHLDVWMELIAPLQEIIEIVIVVWSVFHMEVFSERFPHVKDFAVFSFIFLERCAVDDGKFLEFSDRSKSHIFISNQIIQGVVLEIEVFNVFEI